jgi:hypothetical protein
VWGSERKQLLELRYLGFNQQKNARSYRFDVVVKGQPVRHSTVTADLSLFRTHHVGIQEGPALCASKLTADLERDFDGVHELTDDDLRSHADARSRAEAERAEMRNAGRHRPPASARAEDRSPWRHFGPGKPPGDV